MTAPQMEDLSLIIIEETLKRTNIFRIHFHSLSIKLTSCTFWRRTKKVPYFPFFEDLLRHSLHGSFVTFNGITGLQDWQMSLWYFSTSTLICLVAKLWARKGKKSLCESERKWVRKGGVICWNMNCKPELHHLDREHTHRSGDWGAELDSLQDPSAPRKINLILWFD